jgi:WXG100 family type VII secretion target
MSDGTIRVAAADLEQLASDMRSAHASIRSRLDALQANLERIFGAGWEGQSREAFDAAHAQWSGQIAQMQQIMTDAHSRVIASRDHYAAGDKKAAGFF